MFVVNERISLRAEEVEVRYIYAGGPGGQNVNKVATAAQIRFNVLHSASLPADVRERLLKLAATRINKSGELIITARRYRTQERNRQDALDRLVSFIRQASEKPKVRVKRRPSKTAKKKRLDEKRKHADKKQQRRRVHLD